MAVFGFYGYWWLTILLEGSLVTKFTTAIMAAYMVILLTAVNGTKWFLKKKKVDAGINKLVTLLVDFILAIVMMGFVVIMVIQGSEEGWFEEKGLETYEFMGKTFVVRKDPLPLTVEDLTGKEYTGYSYENEVEKSVLAAQYEVRQWPRFDLEEDSDMPDLAYTITEVKTDSLYEWCKEQLLLEEADEVQEGEVVFQNHYESIDASAWGAEEAYQLYWSDGWISRYIICYEDKIIELNPGWDLTEEQKAIVGEKLK